MKIVIQRILKGAVTSEGRVTGAVEQGMSVLVGICRDDGPDDMEFVIRRILGAKLWQDENGKMWTRNVRDINGGVLLISQFTLMHVMKGNKPDFHKAMPPDEALVMFNALRDKLRAEYAEDKIATGNFQHYMNIDQTMDGPVTLVLDSKNRDK